MKLKFFCPRWGSESLLWDDFFAKVKSAGYDGVEISFPFTLSDDEQQEILCGLKKHNLEVIGQHWQTIESNFSQHQKTYEKHLLSLVKLKPLFINSQTGKDYFTADQNLALMDIARKISEKTGIKILHETHRGKWSFAAHITHQYLLNNSQIRITLDISHWYNVAETLLEDQKKAVELAIQHTDHLHARVGFQEGPQVIDPRISSNKKLLAAHLKVWDKLLKSKSGNEFFTITPEYGAPPYQQLDPKTLKPLANQWEINLWMKELLKKRYSDL
jgi:sugar phosphate isomerase/epimerase